MSASASVILALSFACASTLWALYGLPGLIGITSGFTELCQSLFARCLEYFEIIKFMSLWLGAALLSGGLVYSIVKNSLGLARSYCAVARLPIRREKGAIVIIDDGSKAAFTHGVLRPRIYLTRGLFEKLPADELKAVFLHELHHRKENDPLKFAMLSFFKDLFFYVPLIRDAVESLKLKMEHASDDAAGKFEKERLVLASALVKVARSNYHVPATVSITGDSQLSSRVRRLLEGKEPEQKRPRLRVVVPSIAIAALLAFSLAYPVAAKTIDHECTLKQCSVHVDKVAKCREHCDTRDAHRKHAH